jgi:hypothetical protein
MPKEKMERPASPWGLKNRHYALPFIVHDDDDYDDDDDDDDDDFLQSLRFFNPVMAKSRCSRYFCQSIINAVSR